MKDDAYYRRYRNRFLRVLWDIDGLTAMMEHRRSTHEEVALMEEARQTFAKAIRLFDQRYGAPRRDRTSTPEGTAF